MTATLERKTFGYDLDLDYLTGANYGDGLPNATPTWSYDASGNRTDVTTDTLNRATVVNGAAVTNDVLGNRLTKSGVTYGWDALNRLTSLSGSTTASYQYRADGMRVAKVTGGTTTLYRHDGQMGMEDVESSTSGTVVTRYGLGARGVDFMERTSFSGTVTGFPIYDAHGNNVATLSRSGTSYAVNDRRTYDAWGGIRAQQSSGDPKLRYCANLGHKQDDETGLIYMRARYYEPASGRFVSEDTARDDQNWFVYCGNNPVSKSDPSGKSMVDDFYKGMVEGFLLALLIGWKDNNLNVRDAAVGAITGAAYESAKKWIEKFVLSQTASKAKLNFAGNALKYGGAASVALATLYGLKAGQWMYEIFAMENDDLISNGYDTLM